MTNERPWLRVWLTYKFFKFGMMIGFDRRKFIDFFPFIKQKVKNIKATWEALSVYEEERENLGREKKKEGFR